MRHIGCCVALAAALVFPGLSAQAATISGTYSKVLTAGEASSFVGDLFGTPFAEYQAGDLLKLTFSYDPTLMTQDVGSSSAAYFGDVHFELQIGPQHFSIADSSVTGRVFLYDGTSPFTHLYTIGVSQSGPGLIKTLNLVVTDDAPLYASVDDLASVRFIDHPANFDYHFESVDPDTGGTDVLGGFSTHGAATVPTSVTPVPATLPLLASAISGLGVLAYRRRQVPAANSEAGSEIMKQLRIDEPRLT